MNTTFKVGRYDYPSQFSSSQDSLLAAIRDMLLNGDYILGAAVRSFEEEFARYLGGRVEVIGVNSGTDALILALAALGIGPGDEVITVANTFHSTALAIRRVGAMPVLVDCDPDTYLMNIPEVEKCITERTRAILPVHLYGQVVDLEPLRRVAAENDLTLVEDCAQATGARSGAVAIGTASDAGCWSFVPSKNLAAAGDGGAISVRDPAVARRLRALRHLGQHEQNQHEVVGYNSRLDSLQALVLSHKLPRLDEWNSARRTLAESYHRMLKGLPVSFQSGAAPGEHVYHLFQLRLQDNGTRDRLLARLRDASIDAVVRYPRPIHLQAAFQDLHYSPGAFPVAEALSREALCLPLFPSMSENAVEYVCEQVTRFFGGAR